MNASSEKVVVCGAGAAGLAAALAAARAGADVWLVEARTQVGGTVADALIHTLAGIYDAREEYINSGLVRELAEQLLEESPLVRRRRLGRAWVLNVSPETYLAVVQRWLASEKGIRVLTATRAVKIVREGQRITELELFGPGGAVHVRTAAVIDTTGTAELVRLLDPSLLQIDSRRAAGGLIFTLRGVAPGALAFPRGLGVVRALHAAAAEGSLPADCGKVWIDVGVCEDEVYVKLFVPLADDWREQRDEILQQARTSQAAIMEFLKRLPSFAQARVARTGGLGVRDGGRIHGDYCLSGDDVRQGRKFPDAACRGCWPIEYWDPRDGVSLEYLPDDSYYEIPLRALKVRSMHNVWAAGKCLSADREAHASARVVGTCWAMGEAVGKAAWEEVLG